MPLTVHGAAATVRLSYQIAATLGAWTIEKPDDGPYALRADVVSADTYRLSQRPLVFVVAVPSGSWRWPVTELQIAGASLSATLGPKEKA